jgi:hypothetical protein
MWKSELTDTALGLLGASQRARKFSVRMKKRLFSQTPHTDKKSSEPISKHLSRTFRMSINRIPSPPNLKTRIMSHETIIRQAQTQHPVPKKQAAQPH